MFDWVIKLAYGITNTIAYFLGLLYQCFELVVGLKTVTYNGSDNQTLLEVVFGNSMLTRAYWGMAIIGIGLCFFFTIIAVIKKMFDSSDQMKTSMGEILTQCLKSILLICSMSLILNMALYFSKELLRAIQYAFYANTSAATKEEPKTFSEDEYATMARVLNTIGNYSLNPSYNSRYNVNSCYNEIRQDLQTLVSLGTFDVQYDTPDMLHNSSHYWQESLQKIVNAAPNLKEEMPLDVYNEALSDAILDTMHQLMKNDDFKPLDQYANLAVSGASDMPSMDRIVLLMGTFDAALNDEYNGDKASLTDPVRAPYYYEAEGKDVYSFDDMKKSFDMWDFGYFTAIFLSYVLLKNMVGIVLNCIARIFNMSLLYVVAPPFIALAPMDGGAKFKQWTTAFVIQCFGVFGTVVGMDMMVVFVPIIMNNSLVLFPNSTFVNYFAKVFIVWGAYETVQKASSLVTSILAENASWNSAAAGDLSQSAAKVGSLAGRAAGMAGSALSTVTGVKAAKWAIGQTWDNAKARMKEALPWGKKDKDQDNKKFVKANAGGQDKGAGGQTNGETKQEDAKDNDPNKITNDNQDTDQKNDASDNPNKMTNDNQDTGQKNDNGNQKGEAGPRKRAMTAPPIHRAPQGSGDNATK